MIIWKAVPVPIKVKILHIHKIGKRVHRDFTNTYGEIPVCRINEQTGRVEPVVNPRGYAYAARNRLMYKPKLNKLKEPI